MDRKSKRKTLKNAKTMLKGQTPKFLSLTALPEDMPVIGFGLEEHIAFRGLMDKLPDTGMEAHIMRSGVLSDLLEAGPKRLAAMDKNCTAIQVLSWDGPGADLLTGAAAIQFAREVNDNIFLARRESAAAERFMCFAHLPMLEPKAACTELRRCVKKLGFVGALISGIQGGGFLDEEMFTPILKCAESLDVPIYLHPGPPPKAVNSAYYFPTKHLSDEDAYMLSIAGCNNEVGLHILRMCFSGTFERHPKLKIIIGHCGGMLPMMMHRADTMVGPGARPISDILRKHVWVSISGMFTMPAVRVAIDTFGSDRICWSVDYPWVSESGTTGRHFVKTLRDTLGQADFEALMYKNAAKLLKVKI